MLHPPAQLYIVRRESSLEDSAAALLSCDPLHERIVAIPSKVSVSSISWADTD